MATESYDDPDPINLGAGFEITVKELAEKIRELTGFQGKFTWDTTKPDGQPRRCLDTTRAKERFSFAAEMPLEEGLKQTIAWWRKQGKK